MNWNYKTNTHPTAHGCPEIQRLSDNSKSCGKEGILELYIEKGGRFLLLAVIVGQTVHCGVAWTGLLSVFSRPI